MIPNIKRLEDYSVFHAGRRKIMHPVLAKEIYSQTAVRYMRFLRKVKIDYLELSSTQDISLSGRWVPRVPTHPAHIIVSVLDRKVNRWKVVKESDLPLNPKFAGEGLSQDMPISEMEEFFRKAVESQLPYKIDLDGIESDCIKIECDREHHVWPNHGECNGGPYNVPFGILQPLVAFGIELEEYILPKYRTKLEKGQISPSAPEGMRINTDNPLEIVFSGKKLSIGFSLIRPMIMHFAWNYWGSDDISKNKLVFKCSYDQLGENGPSYITPNGNFCSQNMTGRVSVEGNKVSYEGIESSGITLKAVFTVEAESLTLELEQKALRDTAVLEGEAWRFLYNMRTGITGVAAVPAEKEGRNGFVKMPAMLVGDDSGCLSIELKEGNGMLHTESYRKLEARSLGFVLGRQDDSERPVIIPEGISRAIYEIKPSILLPVQSDKEGTLSNGLRKCWSAGFTAFRPELGGFSNNSISSNCHVNQHVAFDFAAFTAKPSCGIDPIELVKFSIGRALMDGGGYGYYRSLYMDSDPILLSGVGRIFQLCRDRRWLDYVKPGIIAAAKRIIENFDEKEGMILCRALSGNSGSYRWSSNAMDVIGFGHIDAYVNAWSFRALKNATTIFKILGNDSLSQTCKDLANAISENYAHKLINPETGWVSGWKSRDGQLHDFGFLWINGVACAFGVMDESVIRKVLGNLERKRQEIFPESGYLGLPLNLFPIKESDHYLPRINKNYYSLAPTFETYTDGALSVCFMGYYLRALSTYGYSERAKKIIDDVERGYVQDKFHGPYGTGKEFVTWSGADSGYEGTFLLNSAPLYAIAIERGCLKPLDPEWWIDEQ